jgi:hypothetical protein
VQAFIDEEHAETTYHSRYQGLYDQRYIWPGDLAELRRAGPVEFADRNRLAETHSRLYDESLKTRMEAHQTRSQEYDLLTGIVHGVVQLKTKDFQFRGSSHQPAEAKRLLDQVQKELDQDLEWMKSFDRQVFLVHDEMARQVDPRIQGELEERYRFHLALQAMHSHLSDRQQQVNATLNQLAGKRELSKQQFQGAVAVFGQAHDALRASLEAAGRLRLPALKNVTPGAPLGPLLMTRLLVSRVSENQNSLNGEWIREFLNQLGEVLSKIQRLHFKSLGGILALQEEIGRRWAALPSGEPTILDASPPSTQPATA